LFLLSATQLVIVGGRNIDEQTFDSVTIYTISTGINCFLLFYTVQGYLLFSNNVILLTMSHIVYPASLLVC
jgi:hypothetical protein